MIFVYCCCSVLSFFTSYYNQVGFIYSLKYTLIGKHCFREDDEHVFVQKVVPDTDQYVCAPAEWAQDQDNQIIPIVQYKYNTNVGLNNMWALDKSDN